MTSPPARATVAAMTRLLERLTPCGPVVDPKAAERAHETIVRRVGEAAPLVEAAWPALAPIFSASPYLTGLARRDGQRLPSILDADPEARLARILAAARAVAVEPDFETARKALRELKADFIDEHFYQPPDWFLKNVGRYDSYPRTGPKIFVGEYAAHLPSAGPQNMRPSTLEAALADLV